MRKRKNRIALEEEAEEDPQAVAGQGQDQRELVQKDLEGLIDRLNSGDLLDNMTVKQLSKRANQAGRIKKRLGVIQTKVVEATGLLPEPR